MAKTTINGLEREVNSLKKLLSETLKAQKVKSVITATKEKPKSVLGSFVIIYEKPTDKGFIPLRISYAPFKDGKNGMISIRQWNSKMKCHNYVSFNTELTFGTLAKMVSAFDGCEFTEYVKE
jgi:folate-dependent tRNA-U54 methylase TrmFO/GidA